MKKTIMLLVAGMACLIYGGTTWAAGGVVHRYCKDKVPTGGCPAEDCQSFDPVGLPNCPSGSTSTVNAFRSIGVNSGTCASAASGTCNDTFDCPVDSYFLPPNTGCNDIYPLCSGWWIIQGCSS